MINDYAELISEVTERSGVTDVANRAKMYVGMAEKALSKRLRLEGQETDIELTTDADGEAALPADFEEFWTVQVSGKEVRRKSLSLVSRNQVCAYATKGKTLISHYKSQAHTCVYFASIPSLETNDTNWLLDDEPEIYMQAVLFQIYTAKNEIEKAQATAAYLAGLIEIANDAARIKRHSGTQIHLAGYTP